MSLAAPTTRSAGTCQRIAVEREIVTMAVDALLKLGLKLNTDYGDGPVPLEPTSDRDELFAALFQGDEDWLLAYAKDDLCVAFAWIHFIYGNSGYDVISDYTTNLESELKDVMAFCKELM